MSAPDLPPPIPTEFQIYNSYVEDPKWQRKFSAIWAAAVGLCILFALPRFVKALRSGRMWGDVSGLREGGGKRGYDAVGPEKMSTTTSPPARARTVGPWVGWWTTLSSFALWSVPHIGLDAGQLVVIVGYIMTLLICISMQAPLIDNPNRAGFLALAQFPVVFLFATKNSVLSLALGPGHGWEKLNYIHRWSGRGMFLAATVHGSLWIRNHLQYGIDILSQQKETSGIAALGVLGVIVLSSLKPLRAWAYQVFFAIHVLGFVAFFITICYHTIYARPWIYPPIAFYGLDLLMRLLRLRIKDATLVACDNQMTIIHVHDCDSGWVAGQHVRLRVFFGARLFESHPMTILSAPPQTSCLSSRTLTLGARVMGDWTRALNAHALTHGTVPALAQGEKTAEATEDPEWLAGHTAPVHVMLDGPYGGCSVDLGEYERVLLVSGGSGATFGVGMLDDIVGRCVRLGRRGGERTRKVEFVWCIRSYGCIQWFGPMLADIAAAAAGSSLAVHISIFVTCHCTADSVPVIPNSDVVVERPSVHRLLDELVAAPAGVEGLEGVQVHGGGVAVCAAGPERLTRAARNAAARVSLARGRQLGAVACHTEVFSL